MSRGGHTHGHARLPVESCHSLSAWGYFQRAQMWTDQEDDLEFSWHGDDARAVIEFTRNGRAHVQEIALTRTPCNFGGVRFWFVCPGCGRKVGKVYLPCTMYVMNTNARVWWWLCRHCFGLTYEQRRERAPYWSAIHRAERIEEKWLGDVASDFIGRRKGQHWATFEKRADQYERAIAKHNAAGWAGFGKLARRLGLDYEEIKK